MDLVLLSLLRDGLLRRSEAAELRWSDAEFRGDGAALLHIPQSKTDQEAEGVVLYIGRAAAGALQAIRPAEESLDRNGPVFGLSSRQIGRRVQAGGPGRRPRRLLHRPQQPRGHGPGPSGHRGGATGPDDLRPVEERQAADREAVARYYQESGG